MTRTCNKCNKTFATIYTLERHLKRKIPCDRILKCRKCDKIFKTQYELDSHLNRKTPCRSDTEIISSTERELRLRLEIAKERSLQKERELELRLEIAKEKTLQKERDASIQLEIAKEKTLQKENDTNYKTLQKENDALIALEITREKTLQKEKEFQIQLEIAKEKNLQKENNINYKTLQKEKDEKTRFDIIEREREKQISIIEAKKVNTLEIVAEKRKSQKIVEKLKLVRKGQTAQNIQNINITNNINNVVNIGIKEIEKTYYSNNIMRLTELPMLAESLIESIQITKDDDFYDKQQKNAKMLELYNKSHSSTELMKNILIAAFNDPKKPEDRCIFYLREIDKFLGITGLDEHKDKPIQVVEFTTFLSTFLQTLTQSYEVFKSRIPDHLDNYASINEENKKPLCHDITYHDKLLRVLYGIPAFSKSTDTIRKIASDIFELSVEEKFQDESKEIC